MDIRNATQFANFITKGELQNLDMVFQQVIFCLNNYSAMCNCRGAGEKAKAYENCTTIYKNAVQTAVPRFKTEFLSKTGDRQIQFYLDNGSLIGLVCR